MEIKVVKLEAKFVFWGEKCYTYEAVKSRQLYRVVQKGLMKKR